MTKSGKSREKRKPSYADHKFEACLDYIMSSRIEINSLRLCPKM